ncbi:hypothetical protein Q8G16_26925, partial [Klebsiella pneumoniae]|nr:hypothetical protein [Klebsiella pneumoniae]
MCRGRFARVGPTADDSVVTFLDDHSAAKKPNEAVVNAGYLAQSGNTNSPPPPADPPLSRYGNTPEWPRWG